MRDALVVDGPDLDNERRRPGVIWGGHSTVLVELDGVRLITDPVLRRRVVHLVRQAPDPGPGFSRDPDAILISHLHFDHLDLPTLKRYGSSVRVIVPAGGGRILRHAGFRDVVELRAGETATVGAVTVVAVMADHDGRRSPFGRAVDALGYEITGSHRVYFAGDTDFHPSLAEFVTEPDLALLPIWGWGHRLGPGHMDPRGAAQAAALIRPGLTVPIHWGTYFPAGMRRIRGGLLEKPAVAFRRQMEVLAPGREFRILRPGESTVLPEAMP